MQKLVILFDGECNLCTSSVRFIIERDPHDCFTFASLQSPAASRLLQLRNIAPPSVDSFVLVDGPAAYSRSDAALRVAARLSGWWPILSALWIIPRPIRDGCYSFVARNRFRWFGRAANCMVPTPELSERFLA